MRGISLAVTMGLIAATFHSSRKVWEPGRHWLGHQYPINNKKGYASRDKRASKKAEVKRMLGEWIKHQIEEQERRDERERLDRQYRYLVTMPANTFAAIYAEFQEDFFSVKFNDEWYGDWQIYHASLARDEGYEDFI